MAMAWPHRTCLNAAAGGAINSAHARHGAGANYLMAHPGVDYDVIYQLVDAGYLTGPHRFALVYGLEPDAPDAVTYNKHQSCCVEAYRKQGEAFFYFHLTANGRQWLANDPMTGLLRAAFDARRRGLRLDEAVRLSDEDTVRRAWDDGLLTLHHAGDLRETTFSGSGTRVAYLRYVFRHAGDFTLLPDANKIRNMLG
jgi:hypothetical protein